MDLSFHLRPVLALVFTRREGPPNAPAPSVIQPAYNLAMRRYYFRPVETENGSGRGPRRYLVPGPLECRPPSPHRLLMPLRSPANQLDIVALPLKSWANHPDCQASFRRFSH